MIGLGNHLKLERPIVGLDFETTGVDVFSDRILQIGFEVHHPNGEIDQYQQIINPGCHIPQETIDVHHITQEMVEGQPSFADVAQSLIDTFEGCDFTGHNVIFDLKIFRAEVKRAGLKWNWEETDSLVVDTLQICRKIRPMTLSDAYQEYTGKELSGAHDALIDVQAARDVLIGQLDKHQNIPRTVKEIYDFCFPIKPGYIDRTGKIIWKNGMPVFSFAKKYPGVPLQKIPKYYMQWVLDNDFPSDTKAIVRECLNGNYPTKQVPDAKA